MHAKTRRILVVCSVLLAKVVGATSNEGFLVALYWSPRCSTDCWLRTSQISHCLNLAVAAVALDQRIEEAAKIGNGPTIINHFLAA